MMYRARKNALSLVLCALLASAVSGCGLLQFAPLLLAIPSADEEDDEPPSVPIVTSVAPAVGPLAGGTPVTVSGQRFQAGCAVSFGANAAGSIAFVNETQLTCTTPAGAAEGAVSVTVTNPDSQSHSLAAGFTYDDTPPGEVTGFSATPGNLLIDLAWGNPGDADFAAVIIRRSTTSFPLTPTDGNPVYSGTGTAHSDTGLSEGILYYYTAFTVDNVQNGSSGVNASATIDITAPGEVTAFTATPNGLVIDLTWNIPGDADFAGVEIRRSTTSFPLTPADGTSVYIGTGNAHTDSGVSTNILYYYTAFTFDGVPNYSSGATDSAVIDLIPPPDVVNFTATPGSQLMTLSWTNPASPDFVGVMIRRGTSGFPLTTADGTLVYSGATSPQVDSPLNEDYTYYYTAFAYDAVPNYTSGVTASADLSNATCTAVGWIGINQTNWQQGTSSGGGIGYMQFNNPRGLCVDGGGNIYIADMQNDRIPKWNNAGVAQGWIGGAATGWSIADAPASGAGDYQSFDTPYGVFVDGSNDIYVADRLNHRISKWNAAGNAIGYIGCGQDNWQTTGSGSGQGLKFFDNPSNVWVDGSGNIYVTDGGNYRISVWDSNGIAQHWIGGGQDGLQTGTAPASGASDYRSFDSPSSVCVDANGNMFVADTNNNRISKWDASGNAVGWIGGAQNGWQTASGAGAATDHRSFDRPSGVCVDARGYIYVADTFNYRVSKWTATGDAVGWIGGASDNWKTGVAPSANASDYQSFHFTYGVFVVGNRNIFATDANNRVSKWSD